MRLRPLLDYSQYRQIKDGDTYRFSGNLESITDDKTLWVRGDDLTIPVSLAKAKCFLLPPYEGNGVPDAPEQIRWNQVSTLTEGSKVFIGGLLKTQDNRINFVSANDNPLIVIFYNCRDEDLASLIIRAARTRNEYWNNITPISLAIGSLILIYIAASFLNRPAFRLTVVTALTAIFIPVLPVLPPGFLLTLLYRRFTEIARKLRASFDLACFNLLPDAEKRHPQKSGGISGARLSHYYAIRAYLLEALAWVIMLLGIVINLVFIFMILFQFKIISF